ncbi:MAG: hypothetical protein IPQ08_06245 [Chitinophagaceae bacterium]|nr:hypothetical protein [Chitinophagaceae bacterium]
MAFLPSTWPGYFTVEETKFKAADSEYTQQRLGQTANYLKDSNDAILLNITTLARVAAGTFTYGALGFGNYTQFTTPNGKAIISVTIGEITQGITPGTFGAGLFIPGQNFPVDTGGIGNFLSVIGTSSEILNLSVNFGTSTPRSFTYSILYTP